MARNPGIPKYRLIADTLQRQLSDDGDGARRLPSERELARRFGVARNTAKRALDYLEESGFVARIQGSGSFATSASVRVVHGIGPDLRLPTYDTFFTWLGHGLSEAGLRLVLHDSGSQGQHFREWFHPPTLNRSEGIIWIPPHPIKANALAIRYRRRLARRLAMVLVSDPLGVPLQGSHRVDLVHFDFHLTAHRLVSQLLRDGYRRPVLVLWDDLTSFALDQLDSGFMDALWRQGYPSPADHILRWRRGEPEHLRAFFARHAAGAGVPDFIFMHPDNLLSFRADCAAAGVVLGAETALVTTTEQPGVFSVPVDFRETAAICVDLFLSRLKTPNRPNVRLAVNVPVRRRRR